MRAIKTEKVPAPGGHYSQAVEHNGIIYLSAQLPVRQNGELVSGPVSEQALQILNNMKSILEEAGSGIENILKTTIYLTDLTKWTEVNSIYADFFGDHRPARAVIPVRNFKGDFQVQMDCIAALNK